MNPWTRKSVNTPKGRMPQPLLTEDHSELVSFLQSRIAFWQEDKVYATMFTLFPHVRLWIKQNTQLLYKETARAKGPMSEPVAVADQFKCATALYVLGPYFGCDTTMEQRVYQCAEVAAQDAQVEMPSFSFFQDVLRVCRFQAESREDKLDELFSRLLAINKGGVYDPDVTEEDLGRLVIKVNPGEGDVSAWANALFNQARMLYHGANKKNLQFVQLLLPYTEMLCQSMGQTWQDELFLAKQRVSEDANKPYKGLDCGLRRHCSYPRLALIARVWRLRDILFYQHLSPPMLVLICHIYLLSAFLGKTIRFQDHDDEDDLMDGISRGTGSRLALGIDMAVCEAVSTILPTTSLDYVTAMIMWMSPAEADALLKKHSHLDREQVYLYMMESRMCCEWLDRETRRKENNVRGQTGAKLEDQDASLALFPTLSLEIDRIQKAEKEIAAFGFICWKQLMLLMLLSLLLLLSGFFALFAFVIGNNWLLGLCSLGLMCLLASRAPRAPQGEPPRFTI